ncbi:UNVERIFIED_ORG: putative addiction module antidote protein [Agrobacterium larrymoorei]|nr:putative addiction module antidote protein [Agrobacterium larrymoorei]
MTKKGDDKSSPRVEFTKFDASDYLDSEETISEFLDVIREDNDPRVIASALRDAAKARARLPKLFK